MAKALRSKRMRNFAGMTPATAFLCLFLSGCVSSGVSGLGIASQNTQTPAPTPQLAVLASGSVDGSQTTVNNSGTVLEQPQTISQASNAPQLSPIKRQTAQAQPAAPTVTPSAQLAIADPRTTADPAVQQVANVVDTTTAATAPQAPSPATPSVPEVVVASPTTTNTANTGAATTDAPTVVAAAPTTIASAATETPTVVAAISATPQEIKKPSLLERLFGNRKKKNTAKSENLDKRFASASSSRTANLDENNLSERLAKPRPKNKIKTVTRDANIEARLSDTGDRASLPGVKSNSEIFGIKEDPQVKENKQNTQLASLGNLGRLSHKDLRVQHSKVQVACLKPGVLKVLKLVERKYGKKPIITSGYRSPKRNRRAGGARRSQHVFCKAVDIQVEGVSKWQLAKYLRSIPGRGGVGTYCRTKSVHVDIGSKRDWHHKCRRSAKRKRKKA